MEMLTHLINMEVEHDHRNHIQLSKGKPKLSYLIFADDLILSAEASMDQVKIITRRLTRELLKISWIKQPKTIYLPRSTCNDIDKKKNRDFLWGNKENHEVFLKDLESCFGKFPTRLLREDIHHVFRECKHVKEVWTNSCKGTIDQNFFTQPHDTWLCNNLKVEQNMIGNWTLLFVVAIDYIWRAQNECLFRSKSPSAHPIKCTGLGLANYHTGDMLATIKWQNPPFGTAKLNYDGVVSIKGVQGRQ
ncbi:hypothetical protein CR513_37956, partial [Mucuna pruriens]